MSKSLKIGVVVLVLALIFIGVVDATKKKPIDWTPTLNYKDKIPFGTYILFKELKSFYPENDYFHRINEPLYSFMETYNSYYGYATEEDTLTENPPPPVAIDTTYAEEETYEETAPLGEAPKEYEYYSDIFCINSGFEFGKGTINYLLNFAEDGGNVFISAYEFEKELKDTLGIETQYFSDYACKTKYEKPKFSLSIYPKQITYDKDESCVWFSKLPKEAEILGYFHRGKVKVPTFIRIPKGDGYIYIHSEPNVFTNYYLLKDQNFKPAFLSLRYMNGYSIAWYDGEVHAAESEDSIVQFILKNKSLRWAWYILLFALVMYLIFRSKREQKAIPVVVPEENKSVEFAKTISSLYYEKGSPANMIQKKIDYFLFHLRRRFLVDTGNILDPKFQKIIKERSSYSQEDIEKFFFTLNHYYKKILPTEQDLIQVDKFIEEFESKVLK